MAENAHPTQASLLVRLRHASDDAAWARFVEVYTPLVHRFVRSKGLQPADACDVAQEVMRTVARTMPGYVYDPCRGKFRHWLLTVTRRKLIDFVRVRDRRPEAAGESGLDELRDESPNRDELSVWDLDYHRRLFDWAATQLRPKVNEATWQAFWRTAIDEQDPQIVAEDLGLNLGTVYVAKSRMIARLRGIIRSIDEEADAPPASDPRPSAEGSVDPTPDAPRWPRS